LGTQLYLFFQDSGDRDEARVQLDTLLLAFEKAKTEGEQSFILTGPKDWWVIAWPYQKNPQTPQVCKGESCICLCAIPSIISQGNALDSCNLIGECRVVAEPVKTLYYSKDNSWYAELIRIFSQYVGEDTQNVPIDIREPVDLRVAYGAGFEVIKDEQ
jgi:hypothetical protein